MLHEQNPQKFPPFSLLNMLMLSRHLLYTSVESLFFFCAKHFQAASLLWILSRLGFSSNPAVEEELLFPVEGYILCLHILLWTCLSCYPSVLKGVLLDCHIEAQWTGFPQRLKVFLLNKTLCLFSIVFDLYWFGAPRHSKQINCSAA